MRLWAPVVAATVDALVAKPFAWAPPLRVVAPLLTAAQLNRLWEAALREEEERPKEGLAILAAYVDWDRRDEALRLALGYEHQLVPDALRGLVPHLDDAQRRRAYEGVQEIEELPSRASALAELVPYLPAAEAEAAAGEAVATAGAVRGPAARARLLVGLVPLLRGPARKTALAWAFAAATAIPPEERDLGFTALTALVPLLPEPAERE